MLLGCLRQNIKFVLLGPSVLMVFHNPYVVCFFSCISALSEGNHGKKNRQSNKDSINSEDKTAAEQVFCPGICLWIVFNHEDIILNRSNNW